MRSHKEYEEDDLSEGEQLAADDSKEHLAGISHVVHMGVCQFKLADHIAGISRNKAETDYQDDAAGIEG